ncbi:MAG: DUF1801 domain-containing protein [Euryarchaeota archaeon]|nr:DUF1801 domain-containing protein [Euryarchaeota archaeon]
MASSKKANLRPGPVETYLARLEPKPRRALRRVTKAVLEAAPGAVEAMSYGMPAYKLDGKGIAGFAAFKDHLSFFPMSGTIVGPMKRDLAGVKTSTGTVQFSSEKPLPAALVKKLVKTRIAEIRRRKAK